MLQEVSTTQFALNVLPARPPVERCALMMEIDVVKQTTYLISADTLNNVDRKSHAIDHLYRTLPSLKNAHLITIDLETFVSNTIEQYLLYEYIVTHQHSPLTYALGHALWQRNGIEANSIVNAMLTIEKPSTDE